MEIETKVIELIRLQGSEIYPEECCGFFFGKDGSTRQVVEARPVVNAKQGDKRRRFQISALDYIRAEQHAEESGLTLLGIYHSHPDHPAIPSELDLRLAVPFFSYLILSVQGGLADHERSWRLNDDGQFEEESIVPYHLASSKSS